MTISPLFFYLFAGLAIAFALATVLKKNPATAAFSLIMVFFSFAGIYAVLGAHLVAALQVIVYAGAIMVLFVFVIMLLNADVPSLDIARTPTFVRALGATISLVLLGCFVWAFKNSPTLAGTAGKYSPEQVIAMGGNTRVISRLLFSEWVYPFELTSALILAGIVGAVAIAKRKTPGEAPTGGQQ
jgi:NADH-quinone oxidoreductase subunit J